MSTYGLKSSMCNEDYLLTNNNNLQQTTIVTIDWPAPSPDMSPLEHIWDSLQARFSS
jgi:hypothetical protein